MKFRSYFLLSLAVFAACTANEEPVGPTAVSLSQESISVGVEGGSYQITVTAPTSPKPSVEATWVTCKESSYADYDITYTIEVEQNTLYGERTATVVFYAGRVSGKLTIVQAGREKTGASTIDAAPVNADIIDAGKKVYRFLVDEAGEAILSGVQSGGTANNNDNVNAVYTKTGKHPAVAGYDYIFLQYSPTPAGWDWVVDYSNISAPLEHWNAGGLVSFMWHWNVPNSEADWANGLAGNFDGYNFYSDQTSFDINRALTAGTWENDFILKDIEKVAGYLKLLQDAGIPVLWRPLHEAAGNYTLYGSNGSWFWWGRGGAEPCKKLWKLLRDKLEGEYGLKNLIWVWTLDATQGAEKDYASWYPGNDQVDIIGVDIYADDTAAKARQYNAAVALSGGRKLVTVSECGNIPDPDLCLADGQGWSWFLTWNLEDYKLNTNDYWKKVMSSENVLGREDMPSLK